MNCAEKPRPNSTHWSNNHAMTSRGRTATEKLYDYTTKHVRDRHEHNYDKACKKKTRAQLTTKSQFCLPLTELLPKSLLEITPSSQVAHDLHFFVIIFVSYGCTVGKFTIRQPLSIQHDRLPVLILQKLCPLDYRGRNSTRQYRTVWQQW